jgi:MshEN domain
MTPLKSLARESGIGPVTKSAASVETTPLLLRLMNLGFITSEQISDAQQLSFTVQRSVLEILVANGAVSAREVATVASFEFGRPWINPRLVVHDERLRGLLPRWVAGALCVLPIYLRQGKGRNTVLYIITDDPTNEETLRACELWTGLPTQAMVATARAVRSAIKDLYAVDESAASDLDELEWDDVEDVA